jgi:aspartyl-tRNA(Asn)/glutamyl-tRNA(Gln) amidotransferase subunit A
MSDGLAFLSVLEASERLGRREVTSVELTRLMLERIAGLEPELNAWVTVLEERAPAQAAAADAEIAAGRRQGPLHGIPYGLKDNFETAGILTTAGSPILAENLPAQDATVAARLAAQGGVLLGKNNMLEFAYGSPHPAVGPTTNPWDTERTASGSSGGSAASVAAGAAYYSIGTDTAGSIRIPASWNGLIGVKPTYGRVSLAGVIPLGYTLDSAGPLCRGARDAALVLRAIAGHDARDPASAEAPVPDYLAEIDATPGEIRIGVDREAMAGALEPEVEAAFAAAVDALEQSGARIVPVRLPDPPRAAAAAMVAMQAEAAHYHRATFAARPGDYSDAVAKRLRMGLEISGLDYVDSLLARRELRAQYLEELRRVDAILAPATVIPALTVAEVLAELELPPKDPINRRTRFTAPVNGVGLPAVAAPAGWAAGVPVGVQVIGGPFDEGRLLALAERIHAAWPGRDRHPPLSPTHRIPQ